MQEKYGFVYIWFDRKHKRYYLGSHWGFENDGYICSSNWMRDSYKRRPEDFKRRILAIIKTNREDLYEKEFTFLKLIKDEELGKRYYNKNNKYILHNGFKFYCCHNIPHTEKSKEKIRQSLKTSKKQKEKFTPEVRQKLKEAKVKRTDADFQKIKDALKLVPKQKCVYCGTFTDPGNFKKHHDEKCKHKTLTSNWIT